MLRKTPNLREGLAVLRTHAAMFGFVSCVRATLSYALAPRYNSDNFDAVYGTDTSQFVEKEDAHLPEDYSSDAIDYEPTNAATFRHVMHNLPIAYRNYEFIDLGCGKGRTLLLAGDFPFARIMGVELSPITYAVAERNITQYLSQNPNRLRCPNISVQCANALNFDIPDANIIFFLYNPFVGEVFRRVVQRIHDTFEMRPYRNIFIAYVNAWRGQADLQRTGYFQCIAEHQVIPRNWSWSLWRYSHKRHRGLEHAFRG